MAPPSPERFTLRADWLAARAHSLGASEVAGLVLPNKWASPLSLYHRKRAAKLRSAVPVEHVEPTLDDAETEAQEAGLAYEHANAVRYAKRTGREVHAMTREIVLYRDPTGLRLHASPDAIQTAPVGATAVEGFALVGPAPLEGKHWRWGLRRWDGTPPIAVAVQNLVQMRCMGASWGTCMAVIGGVQLVYHDQPFGSDESGLMALLLERVEDFWRMVDTGREPAATRYDVPHLREWYRDRVERTVTAPDEDAAAYVRELQALLDIRKAADNRIEAHKARALQLIGDGSALSAGGRVIAKRIEYDAPVMVKAGTRKAHKLLWALTANADAARLPEIPAPPDGLAALEGTEVGD